MHKKKKLTILGLKIEKSFFEHLYSFLIVLIITIESYADRAKFSSDCTSYSRFE